MTKFDTSDDIISRIKWISRFANKMLILQVGESLAIPTEDIDGAVVSTLCEKLTIKGERVFVHMRHKEVFEIARVENNFERDLFYSTERTSKDEDDIVGACIDKARHAVLDYKIKSLQEVARYVKIDEQLKEQGYIPYAYLQRSLVSVIPFKHYAKGGTEAVKLAIRVLVNEGLLEAVDKEELKKYGTRIVMYKITG